MVAISSKFRRAMGLSDEDDDDGDEPQTLGEALESVGGMALLIIIPAIPADPPTTFKPVDQPPGEIGIGPVTLDDLKPFMKKGKDDEKNRRRRRNPLDHKKGKKKRKKWDGDK